MKVDAILKMLKNGAFSNVYRDPKMPDDATRLQSELCMTILQERKMNKLRYLLREKGQYKVTFKNGATAFMEKCRYIDHGKGQKAEVGLLFLFPFETAKDIGKLAPNMSEKEIIKAIKKMELVLSYDRGFIDKDLSRDLHDEKDGQMREAAKRGFYESGLSNEKHYDEFNKWYSSYETQKSLDCWCVDSMVGFADVTFERVEYVLYLAFKAGVEAAKINLLERHMNETC